MVYRTHVIGLHASLWSLKITQAYHTTLLRRERETGSTIRSRTRRGATGRLDADLTFFFRGPNKHGSKRHLRAAQGVRLV